MGDPKENRGRAEKEPKESRKRIEVEPKLELCVYALIHPIPIMPYKHRENPRTDCLCVHILTDDYQSSPVSLASAH